MSLRGCPFRRVSTLVLWWQVGLVSVGMSEHPDPNTIEEVHPPEDLLNLFVELDATGMTMDDIEHFAEILEALGDDPA